MTDYSELVAAEAIEALLAERDEARALFADSAASRDGSLEDCKAVCRKFRAARDHWKARAERLTEALRVARGALGVHAGNDNPDCLVVMNKIDEALDHQEGEQW